jgi:hypothetical protein
MVRVGRKEVVRDCRSRFLPDDRKDGGPGGSLKIGGGYNVFVYLKGILNGI